jgi:hypothetical protein
MLSSVRHCDCGLPTLLAIVATRLQIALSYALARSLILKSNPKKKKSSLISAELSPRACAITFQLAIIHCPQNPPDARKSCAHYYGEGCQLQIAGFRHGRKRTMLTPAEVLHIFNGIMWEAFEPSPALLNWGHHVQWPVGGASHCFLLLEVNLDETTPGGFFWKHFHMV